MAFVREELPERLALAPSPPARRLRIPPWSSKAGAIALSLALEALTLWTLLMMGVLPPPRVARESPMLVLDLTSPALSDAGSVATKAPVPNIATATATELDVAARSEIKPEWSMAKLPPRPAAPALPTAALAPGSGSADVGRAHGEGFDPYSFASYQPDLVKRAVLATAPQPDPDALARIEQAIRQRLGRRGIAVSLAVRVMADGRVGQAAIPAHHATRRQPRHQRPSRHHALANQYRRALKPNRNRQAHRDGFS